MGAGRFDAGCAAEQLRGVGVEPEALQGCMGDPGEDAPLEILEVGWACSAAWLGGNNIKCKHGCRRCGGGCGLAWLGQQACRTLNRCSLC